MPCKDSPGRQPLPEKLLIRVQTLMEAQQSGLWPDPDVHDERDLRPVPHHDNILPREKVRITA